MKRTLLLMLVIGFSAITGYAQNVGVNTVDPKAGLHVADSSVVFTAEGAVGEIPGSVSVSGEGRRMLWYAGKGSFRAGYVLDTNWNMHNIGYYSFGSGYNVMAFGANSTAFGANTKATGTFSTAFGSGSSACAPFSTALGSMSKASGDYSTAMGGATVASGIYSTAFGNSSTASGYISTAMGIFSNANGWGSTAFGNYTSAASMFSSALGNHTVAKGFSSTVVGMFNDSLFTESQNAVTATTPLFVVGNGNDDASRSNALTVLKNGAVQFQGVIRNADGGFSKKSSTAVNVTGNFAANETRTFAITWSGTFGSAPEAYVGNIQNAGTGFEGLTMYVYNTTETGATLHVRNTQSTAVAPNFTVRVIAIGTE